MGQVAGEMTADWLVDTDVLVDFLRVNELAVDFVQVNAARFVLSSIVVAELFAGARENELSTLDELPQLFPVAPVAALQARQRRC